MLAAGVAAMKIFQALARLPCLQQASPSARRPMHHLPPDWARTRAGRGARHPPALKNLTATNLLVFALLTLGTLQLVVFWWADPETRHRGRRRRRSETLDRSHYFKPKPAPGEQEAFDPEMSFAEHKRRKRARLAAQRMREWEEVQKSIKAVAKAPPAVTPAELFFMDNQEMAKLKRKYEGQMHRSDDDIKRAMMGIIHDEKQVVAKEEADRLFKFDQDLTMREMRDACNMKDTLCIKKDSCMKGAAITTPKDMPVQPKFKCKQFIAKCDSWKSKCKDLQVKSRHLTPTTDPILSQMVKPGLNSKQRKGEYWMGIPEKKVERKKLELGQLMKDSKRQAEVMGTKVKDMSLLINSNRESAENFLRMDEPVLVPHFDGFDVFHQWVQLQNAAALAAALNRSLCLVPFVVRSPEDQDLHSIPLKDLFDQSGIARGVKTIDIKRCREHCEGLDSLLNFDPSQAVVSARRFGVEDVAARTTMKVAQSNIDELLNGTVAADEDWTSFSPEQIRGSVAAKGTCAVAHHPYPLMNQVMKEKILWNRFQKEGLRHWRLAPKLKLVASKVVEELFNTDPFLAVHWHCAAEDDAFDLCETPQVRSVGRGAQCFVTDQLYKDIGQIDPFSADMTGGEVARRMVTMREIGRAVALRMKLDGVSMVYLMTNCKRGLDRLQQQVARIVGNVLIFDSTDSENAKAFRTLSSKGLNDGSGYGHGEILDMAVAALATSFVGTSNSGVSKLVQQFRMAQLRPDIAKGQSTVLTRFIASNNTLIDEMACALSSECDLHGKGFFMDFNSQRYLLPPVDQRKLRKQLKLRANEIEIRASIIRETQQDEARAANLTGILVVVANKSKVEASNVPDPSKARNASSFSFELDYDLKNDGLQGVDVLRDLENPWNNASYTEHVFRGEKHVEARKSWENVTMTQDYVKLVDANDLDNNVSEIADSEDT